MVDNWQETALRLYQAGQKINDVAKSVGKSRKSVSKLLNSLNNIKELKDNQKAINKERHKEKRKKYKYTENGSIAANVKRQHEVDVRVLSSEQFFD